MCPHNFIVFQAHLLVSVFQLNLDNLWRFQILVGSGRQRFNFNGQPVRVCRIVHRNQQCASCGEQLIRKQLFGLSLSSQQRIVHMLRTTVSAVVKKSRSREGIDYVHLGIFCSVHEVLNEVRQYVATDIAIVHKVHNVLTSDVVDGDTWTMVLWFFYRR